MGGAFVNSPTAGFGVDKAQSPSAELIKRTTTEDLLKAAALIDDLDEQPVLIEVRA
jgi:hypothetical protein